MAKDDNKPTIGKTALSWWSALQPNSDKATAKKGDSGALARLRRAEPIEAATEEATGDLCRRLQPLVGLPDTAPLERAALIAAVLAHVREHDPTRKVAAAAGEMVGDERRVLQPLRLRRLLAARTPAECLTAFRRLVALLGHTANVADLAECLFDWPDEMRGDTRRTRFAFTYYGAAAPQDPADPDKPDQAAA
jgi:CRISPR system Cascade subunit CasB